MESVLAVIVLYKMRAEESMAFVSLQHALQQHAAQGTSPAVEVLVCDNTPWEQPPPGGFAGTYLHDTTNPGLAHWYNVALEQAAGKRYPWLMLLDQDTTVTAEYLAEVLRTTALVRDNASIVALTPKLVQHGVICSPAEKPFLGAPRAVARQVTGASEQTLLAFNSGAVLRVDAVRAAGGFSREFPLDYLDHATFSALQARGGRIHILHATLEHDLSSNAEPTGADAAAALRQNSVLRAERLFYARFGTPAERLLRRVRLLKAVAGRLWRGKERGQTWRMLKSALRP